MDPDGFLSVLGEFPTSVTDDSVKAVTTLWKGDGLGC